MTSLLLTLAIPLFAAATPAPEVIGRPEVPPRNEASGVAASGRGSWLWTHDDSGGAPTVYAFAPAGRSVGQLRLTGTKNVDWEDIAVAEIDGRSWVIVGDIGDNSGRRASVSLHFVPEPTAEQLAAGTVEAAPVTLRYTYPDGARDAEGVAYDPIERAIYLLSKRDPVPRLYRLRVPAGPLRTADLKAEFVLAVTNLTPKREGQSSFAALIDRAADRPCGMDIARDGSGLVVVTLTRVLYFPRQAKEPWATALARPPQAFAPHGLPQAEAVCFSADGRSIYLMTEEKRALLRYERPRP